MKQAAPLPTLGGVVAVVKTVRCLAAVSLVLLAGAADGRALRHGASHVAAASQQPAPDAAQQTYEHWDYEDHGAQSWAALGQCGVVGQQSPIDLSKTQAIINNTNSLYFRMPPYTAPIKMLNNAQTHALEATIDQDAGSLAVGSLYPSRLSSQFKLKRIVFHSPSEHTFRGVRVPLEMQMHYEGMIMAKLEAKVAVTSIGFYTDPNGESPFLESLRQGGLPEEAGLETTVNGASPSSLDFNEVYGPSEHATEAAFWQYDGSETSPPCSVGVMWFVRDDPLPASMEAIDEFRKVISAGAHPDADSSDRGNFRALQSSEGRQVQKILTKNADKWDGLVHKDAEAEQAAAHTAMNTHGVLTSPQWDYLVSQAQAMQQAADMSAFGGLSNADGLSAEELMARNARRLAELRAANANRVLSGSSDLENCERDLAKTHTDWEEAQKHAALECKGQEQAKTDLEEAGPGLAHLAAAKIYNGQTALCDGATKVADALEKQAKQQEINCAALKPPPPSASPLDALAR